MQPLSTCLWFDNNGEEAAKFYTQLFGGNVGAKAVYTEASSKQAGRPVGSTMTVSFEMANLKVLALNGGPLFKFTQAFSFFVSCETEDEINKLWKALNDGGSTRMGLDKYPWAAKYGWTSDKFGVEWQLILSPRTQKMAPAFLFTNQLFGKGQEAVDFYTSIFPNSKIETIAKDPQNGTVMHCAFTLNNQPYVLMEGSGVHNFTFNEAFSIIVNCDTQKEIDQYWEKLVQGGGSHGPCGWLKDRFGVSWQVNPTLIEKYASDPVKMAKAMTVVMKSSKLNIAEIEAAANS